MTQKHDTDYGADYSANSSADLSILAELEETISLRAAEKSGESYTAQLLSKGPEKCAKKFGEEAVEVVLASLDHDKTHLVAEAADVLYHLLVLLKSRNVPLESVMDELKRRTRQSGLEEKASRK